MADRQDAIDPDLVVTEGEFIATVVISVLIFILLVIQIALLIYCFCRKKLAQRCPCFKDRKKEAYPGGSRYTDWREERLSVRSDEEHLIRTEHYATEESAQPVVETVDEFKPVVPPLVRKPTDKDEEKDKNKEKDKDKDKDDDKEKDKDNDNEKDKEKEGDKLVKDEDGDHDKKDSDEKDPDDKRSKGDRGDAEDQARALEKILTPEADGGEEPKTQQGPEDTDPRGKEEEKARGKETQGGDTDITPLVTLTPGRDEDVDPKLQTGPPDTDPKGQDREDLKNTDREERLLIGSDEEGEKYKKTDETPGKEATSSSDTTSSTSDTSEDSQPDQMYMSLPGQTGGEAVPLIRDDGDIRGRGRRFRRPISEFPHQGLPPGLPRFSLPPIGVIGAWEDEKDKDKQGKPRLLAGELTPDEDQGYSEGSRRKGSKGDSTTSSISTPDEPGTHGARGNGPTAGVPGGAAKGRYRDPAGGSYGDRTGGVPGGTTGGVPGGTAGGVPGGTTGGAPGGTTGGVPGGTTGGVSEGSTGGALKGPQLSDKDKSGKKGKEKGKSGRGKGGKGDQPTGKGRTPGQDTGNDKNKGNDLVTPGGKERKSPKKAIGKKDNNGEGGGDTITKPGGKSGKQPGKTNERLRQGGTGDGGTDPRRAINEEDSGISDFGRGDGGSSTDDVPRFPRLPGDYFIDDDDLSSIGEDGWKYWPDTTGRFRGMDQWSTDDGRNEDDLNIEDVEFDDDNKLLRTGESFQQNDPEKNGDTGSKVKDQNKKQPARQKPLKSKSGKVTPSHHEGNPSTKDKDKTSPNKPDSRDTVEKGDQSSSGWESYDDSSDPGTWRRKLGRPPIKDDQTELQKISGWDGPGADSRGKQSPVRLGRGRPADAILEELPGEGGDTLAPGQGKKSKKPKSRGGRDPSATTDGKVAGGSENQELGSLDNQDPYTDGKKTNDAEGKPQKSRNDQDGTSSQMAGPDSKRSSRRRPRGDGSLLDEPLLGADEAGPVEGRGEPGTHDPGNNRRKRRKRPKSHRGPRSVNDNSWDAYLEHDSNLTSPLEFIFFDADLDLR